MSSIIYEDQNPNRDSASRFSNIFYTTPLRKRYGKENVLNNSQDIIEKTPDPSIIIERKSGVKSFGKKGLSSPQAYKMTTMTKKYKTRGSSDKQLFSFVSSEKDTTDTHGRIKSSKNVSMLPMNEELHDLEIESVSSGQSSKKDAKYSTLRLNKSTKEISRLKKELKENHQPMVVDYSSGPIQDMDISATMALRENLIKITNLLYIKKKCNGSEMRPLETSTSPSQRSTYNRIRCKSPKHKRLGSETRLTGIPNSQLSLLELSEKILKKAEKISEQEKSKIHHEFPLRNKIKFLETENQRISQSYEIRIKELESQLARKKKRGVSRKSRASKEDGVYTKGQQKQMVEDYENVLLVLNEKHITLAEDFPDYNAVVDESKLSTSEMLQEMLDYLHKKTNVEKPRKTVKEAHFKDAIESSMNPQRNSQFFCPKMTFEPNRFKGDSVHNSVGVKVSKIDEDDSL
ncbi:unnamed protein product [Moneuplotes crassus]|uniref:Uncharacterized protein n=1 Tax=Euplotes crassus TaxID=5936 RepID=A0AAD1U8E7_EUPCR|nr:unnamed protein product [Moneuplotes crassus]